MPLNGILGTEANVRILRALAESTAPISAAELSRRAQLQRSSVHRALRTLAGLGIVVVNALAWGMRRAGERLAG